MHVMRAYFFPLGTVRNDSTTGLRRVASLGAREHEGTQRDTEGVGCDMSWTLKLYLVSRSLFSETPAQITTSI